MVQLTGTEAAAPLIRRRRAPSEKVRRRRTISQLLCCDLLETLGIGVRIADEDLQRVPQRGRVLAVANQPFGGIEAALLAAALLPVRDDLRILGNLTAPRGGFGDSGARLPHDILLRVDRFGEPIDRAQSNAPLRWLRDEGILAVFPAPHPSQLIVHQRAVVDPQWNHLVAGLARNTCSDLLPVFIEGATGWMSQLAGLINPRLRDAFAARELKHLSGRSIRIHVGNLVPFDSLPDTNDDARFTENVRAMVYATQR